MHVLMCVIIFIALNKGLTTEPRAQIGGVGTVDGAIKRVDLPDVDAKDPTLVATATGRSMFVSPRNHA